MGTVGGRRGTEEQAPEVRKRATLVGTVVVLEVGAERSQGRGARRWRGAVEWHRESGRGAVGSEAPEVRAGRRCGPIREEERGVAGSEAPEIRV